MAPFLWEVLRLRLRGADVRSVVELREVVRSELSTTRVN